MNFKVEINLDNDAYQHGYMAQELSSAMQLIANDIGLGLTKGNVRDTNGNRTGKWIIEDEADEKFIKDHFQFIRIGA